MKFSTFSILGDSISTFAGFIPSQNEAFYPRIGYDVTEVDQTWWRLLEKETSLHLVANESYSGSRVSKTGARPVWTSFLSDKRQANLESETIIIFGGTNDYGQENPASLAVFSAAYEELVATMLANHQQSELFFCTPLQRTDRAIDEPNSQGWNQKELAETIRTCLKRHEKAHLIDLASYPIQQGDGLLQDQLHPTKEGMRLLCRLIKKSLECY
ncbi:lysophospholipase L1-like esterase [Sphaerochaeta pleomorpha str. Grapes]|uniref:Lysophospholipase L1-like esterase n=1 Tax=Sphaerochaeta pleomorpha (strain ATCC BAA-1885 / DSM 22778 / Grapes) TaxID=158190 RepID=G8QV54_SPHPG|nr:SGNH/GDSL hydrolase family protein [Sphaerochaeta pleomorpha]AEV29290.1 lysophospholipase L1-like esterase [Sphaerochaeta pleomorpha str. Grapes]